jgi:AraC-like DNA-binding protein
VGKGSERAKAHESHHRFAQDRPHRRSGFSSFQWRGLTALEMLVAAQPALAKRLDPAAPAEMVTDMNGQLELPGVSDSVAKLPDTARSSLSLDPRAAARYVCEAATLLRPETLTLDVGSARNPGSLARWQLKRALELFETNIDRPIRLGDVAGVVRMSKSYFSRAFSNSMGEPPARYLRRYRVKRAQEMMLLTGESLATIAVDCGFADQPHFTRTFSRMVGASPATWRSAFHPVKGRLSE